MTVTFYGRLAGPLPGPDFTVAVLPDTQYYVSSLNGGDPSVFCRGGRTGQMVSAFGASISSSCNTVEGFHSAS